MSKSIGVYRWAKEPILNLTDDEIYQGIEYCEDFLEQTEGDSDYADDRARADAFLTAAANEISRRREEFNQQGGTIAEGYSFDE